MKLAELVRRLNEAIDQSGSLRAVALLRIAAGPLILLHLKPFLNLAASGATWADRFNDPFFDWYPSVAGDAYVVLLRMCIVAAVLVSLGALTRVATAYAAGFVTWNLFLSVTHFHHNRAFLVVILIGLALLPSGRVLSLDSWLARRRGRFPAPPARLWPLWLMRFEACVVYGASGLSKLIDQDWWNGLVLRLRIEQWADHATAQGVPDAVIDLLASPEFMWWFAKVVVLTELFIAVGLAWRRTRLAAVWVAAVFHLAVELTAEVQVFTWAGLAALLIWVTPAERDRRLVITADASRGAAVIGFLVGWLDWTGRFVVERRDGTDGPGLCLFDRGEGVTASVDAAAARTVLARLPLTFPLAAPLQLPGVRRLWDRLTRRWFAAAEDSPQSGSYTGSLPS